MIASRRPVAIVAGVVALLMLAAAISIALIDVNSFKPQIENAVKEHTGRTLQLEGDLGLSIFPGLAIKLPGSRLSAPDSDAEFLAFASARVEIALLPLLQKKIVVESVRLLQPRMTLTRRAEGSKELDQASGEATSPASAAAPQAPHDGAAASWEIGRLVFTDGAIALHDEITGRSFTLSAIDLETGRLAPTTRLPLSLKAHLASTAPELAGDVKLTATVDIELATATFAATDLSFSFVGTHEQQALHATITASELSPQVLRGGAAEASVSLAGAQPVDLRVALDGVGGTPSSLQAERLSLTATQRDGAATRHAQLSGPVSANLEKRALAMPRISGQLTIEDPQLPEGSAQLPLTGALTLDAAKERLELQLASTAADASLETTITADDFARPRVGFDLRADRINLDRYLPPADQPTAGGKAGAPAGSAAVPAPAGVASAAGKTATAAAGAPLPAKRPADASPWRDLQLTGKLSIGQLQARGIKASAVRASVRSASGHSEIAPASAQLYGGKASASLSLDQQGQRVALNVSLNDVDIGPLARDAWRRDDLSGRGNVDLALTTAGQSAAERTRAARGTARFALRDFALVGIDLSAVVGQVKGALTGGGTQAGQIDRSKRTVLSRLSGTVKFADGIARNDDLDGAAPQLGLDGRGQYDLLSKDLDYTLRVTVTANPARSSRLLTALAGVAVPVHFSGPPGNLRYSINLTDVAADALARRGVGVGATVVEEAQRLLGGWLGGRKKK